MLCFVLRHRFEINPAFGVKLAVRVLRVLVGRGQMIAAFNTAGEVVAVGGYCVGTPENRFEDLRTIWIDMAAIREDLRGTRLFYRGIRFLLAHLAANVADVDAVEFYTSAARADAIRLFGKFAGQPEIVMDRYGEEARFRLPLANLQHYVVRLDGRPLS